MTGLLTGTFAGLVQDAMGTGVIGIGGLTKTLIGFLAGIVGTQFIVAQPLPRFVVFFGATLLERLVFIGLYVLLNLRQFESPYAAVVGQAAANATVGVLAFQLGELSTPIIPTSGITVGVLALARIPWITWVKWMLPLQLMYLVLALLLLTWPALTHWGAV